MEEYFASPAIKFGFDAWRFLDQGETCRILLNLESLEIREHLEFVEIEPLGSA